MNTRGRARIRIRRGFDQEPVAGPAESHFVDQRWAEDIGISECVTVARIGDRDRCDGNVGTQHKRSVLGSKGVGVDDAVHPKARLRREIVVKPEQVFSSGIVVRYLGLKVEAVLPRYIWQRL